MVKIREEIEKWQTSLSTATTRLDELTAEMETLKQAPKDPEAIAEREALRTEIADLKAEIAELKAAPPTPPLSDPLTPPKSGEEENPSPVTPTETLSDPPPAPAPQTKATRRGWI